MPFIADQIFAWWGGIRVTEHGRIVDPEESRADVQFTPMEDKRFLNFPGKGQARLTLEYRDLDLPTITLIGFYIDGAARGWIETLDPAAGQPAIVHRMHGMSNRQWTLDQALALRSHIVQALSGGIQSYGLNLFDHTVDITAPVVGTTVVFPAVSATQSLLIVQEVEAVTGTGTFDSKIVSDPGGTPVDEFTFAQIDETAPPNDQFTLINGAISTTDWSWEVTGVTGGTWNAQVAAVVLDET